MHCTRDPMIVRRADPDGLLRIDRSFWETIGYTESELRQRELLDWFHPEDRPALQEALDRGEGSCSARHQTSSGEWFDLPWTVRKFRGELYLLGGAIPFPHRTGDSDPIPPALTGDDPIAETLRESALIVEEQNPGMLCSIVLLDKARQSIRVGAGPSLPDSYNAAVEGLDIGPGVGSCGTAAFWNVRVFVDDIQNDPLWADLREHAAQAGVGSCWSHPISTRDGSVLGAMALYDRGPRTPTPSEIQGLATAARIVGLTIERGQAEQALRAAERRLQESARIDALSVLAAGVAHDFNNMLASVTGNLELAQDQLPDRPEGLAICLDEALLASRRAAELCSLMLAFAGEGSFSSRVFDFARLVRELLHLLRPTLDPSVSLSASFDEQELFVEADETQLRRVVMNLTKNAVDALDPAAGGTVTIRVDGAPPPPEGDSLGSVRMTVEDTGTGITLENQARVFEPFFTTKRAGRGLGLAAVHGIVQHCGGTIELDSRPGCGTRFTVQLPRVPATAPTSPPSTAEDDRLPESKRVLVVDDDEGVLKAFTLLLERSGFETLSANCGHEAIRLFEEREAQIDCVLLDLNMPNLSGQETLERLRAIDPDVPVVIATGHPPREILERCHSGEINGLLHKPVSKSELLRAVGAASERR